MDILPNALRCPEPMALRELAAQGSLVAVTAKMAAPLVAELRSAAFGLTWPLVYQHHTRRLEGKKGHPRCARSVRELEPGCHDGFSDDVTAVVDYLFTYAKCAVSNLEGWITSRIPQAVVDGYRKRRGELGAQQRPRVPSWLAEGLSHDPWLVSLAGHILEWVGVTATAGQDIWPLRSWAELRSAAVGNWQGDASPDVISVEIDLVLMMMREKRPLWFDRYVAQPMGRKQAPVDHGFAGRDRAHDRPLALAARSEQDDVRLDELADVALRAMRTRIAAAEDPFVVVPEVLRKVFVGLGGWRVDIEGVPGQADSIDDRILSAALIDDARLSRIVSTVLAALEVEAQS